MKTIVYNINYFLTEAIRTIRLHPLSNVFSVIGTCLIFFLLGIVIAGWFVGDQLVDTLNAEAEISVYFENDINEVEKMNIVTQIQSIDGVINASYVTEDEARIQMETILQDEIKLLDLFEENPFQAFIEVQINLDNIDSVLPFLHNINGVDYIRDNREILAQVKGFTEGLILIGSLVFVAVSITTIIIISYMIRQGIYNNREQISTLRLLGAPASFIGIPFVLAGLFLTIAGGLLAMLLISVILSAIYTQISGAVPFMPLPARADLLLNISLLIFLISFLLGILGSLLGLTSITSKDTK